MPLTLRSPAKINLFLRILKKREDGYHELASLFQAVDLCDTLHFQKAEHDQIICDDPHVPLGLENFVIRAVTLFRQKTGITDHFQIEIEKKIPIQAGLGGGSSNCATTLYALNQLCNTQLPEIMLRSWSAEISADAPFFFSSGTAYCEGIGEKVDSLQPLPWLSKKNIIICKPAEGLSTRNIFNHLDLSSCSTLCPKELLESFKRGKPIFQNDLEPIAYKLSPTLSDFKKSLLKNGVRELFMTGSGTAHIFLSSSNENTPNKKFNYYTTSSLQRTFSSWY